MRVTAILTAAERKRQDRSVHRAEERRRRAKMMRVCGPTCPHSSVWTHASAVQAPKRLINKRKLAILTSNGIPLGECRTTNLSAGIFFAVLGMLGFSGTLVATRAAVFDFSPLDITSARIVMAGLLGAIFLVLSRQTRFPERRLVLPIIVMGIGLAVGYPFFLALALEEVPAVHGAVVTGLAPAATAIIAVVRTGERPSMAFWIASFVGFCAVFYFVYDAGGGHLSLSDGWLLLGMLSLGVAYVEGGRVSREIGGTVTLSWAMLFLTPAATVPLFESDSKVYV